MPKSSPTQHAVGIIGGQSKPIVRENERWLYERKPNEDLQRALAWAQQNLARESSVDDIEKLRQRK